ncbi:MAG TPA: GNAT family N-acetyltransferase [Bryobacteraceae bacterium]|nr:GNAT family N-acetyltransferase [Bryobacteraceae bacterium]
MLAPEALTPVIRTARPDEMDAVRALFRIYIDYIGAPECFPSFDAELAALPGRYAPPTGVILVAADGDEIAGLVALRAFDERSGEVKRLFVPPAFHGRGLGRTLMNELIARAHAIGYERLLLDTIPGKMDAAIALYRSLGFREIERYYEDPIPGVLYFELVL